MGVGMVGRPMKLGKLRFPGGKIRNPDKADSKPSASTEGQRGIFNSPCFQGGGHGNQCGDILGMLWLCGYLEGEVDSKELLRVGREWFDARCTVFGEVRSKAGKLEPAARTSGQSAKRTKADRLYERYSANLRGSIAIDAQALLDLMEEDVNCLWAHRLVSAYVSQKAMRGGIGAWPSFGDDLVLARVKRALVALHGGVQRRAA